MRLSSFFFILILALISLGFLTSETMRMYSDLKAYRQQVEALSKRNAQLQQKVSDLEKQLEACRGEGAMVFP